MPLVQIRHHDAEPRADRHRRAIPRHRAPHRREPAGPVSRGPRQKLSHALPRADLRQVRALPHWPRPARRFDGAGARRRGDDGDRRHHRAHGAHHRQHRRLRHRARCRADRARRPRGFPRRLRGARPAPPLPRRGAEPRALRRPVSGRGGHPRLRHAGQIRQIRGRGEAHPQGQPLPHRLRLHLRASLRGALPPQHDRRRGQHPRPQALRRRPRGRCAEPGKRRADRQARRRHRRRPGRAERGVLPRAHGPQGHGVRKAQAARRNAALRHPRLPPAAREAGRGDCIDSLHGY